jgi:3-dehydroquinate synthetase
MHEMPEFTLQFTKTEIFSGLLLDKKRRGNSITLVLPQKIGKCKLVKTDIEKFKETFLDER